MTVDVEVDLSRAIGLAAAAKLMRGRGGKPPSVESVRRWANPKRGCRPRGKDGPQVLLMTIRVSNELVTLPEWVQAFEAKRAQLGLRGAQPAAPPVSDRTRQAENRRADEVLARAGIATRPPAKG